MTVKRIVPNLPMTDESEARRFYQEVLDLNLVMDLGWVKTFSADSESKQHISIVAPDASGLPIPDVSIEVEDVDLVYQKAMSAGHEIIYGIVSEQWGVRRFFVREPAGKILNIMAHIGDG